MESMGLEENYPSRLEWEAAGESLMAPVFWVGCLSFVVFVLGFFLLCLVFSLYGTRG